MAKRYISNLAAGDRIDDEVFLVRSKDLRTTSQGGLYIHAVLADKTGQLPARMWQATESIFEALPEGGFMRFKGRAENYKGSLQFIIDAIRLADPGTFDVADFLPTTKNDIEKMWTRTRELLSGIRHPELKALIDEFLADKDLMTRFRRAPAAINMHHAYIGGLLEHTLNLLEIAIRVMPLYPRLSQDLVVAGLFLHDIGKAKELACDTCLGYTDEGQLVGHIVQAANWIDRKADAVAAKTGKPFPNELRWVLQHIVLSHHGQYEFGSPKLPAVPEAIVVHLLDNLDAKANIFLSEIENSKDPASRWANYNHTLQTKVFKPDIMGVRRGA